MPLHVDIKYLGLISSRFRNFKRIGNNLWNCSCPLCGDSKKYPLKARGYFYVFEGELWNKCWNCNKAMPFKIFLWEIDKTLHREYCLEVFEEKPKSKKYIEKEDKVGKAPTFENGDILKNLVSIESMSKDHPARKYVENRMIPQHMFSKLFLVKKFMAWTNSLVPGKFGEGALKYDSPRLLIPFYDKENNVFAYTGRAFDQKDKKKYIMIKLYDNVPSVYGLERVNENKLVYVFEGPLDSLFIDNSVAMAGTGGKGVENMFENSVIILDNDKRNKHVGKRIEKLINMGKSVCLWNNSVSEDSDVNSLIMSGWTAEKIKSVIDASTFRGLEAQLEFNEWKKY